ncbi:CU044_5270 family protein [Streptomyces europaeiscabiei]|uniref:CU044_5270 family protein n=1 Tax=Streptomyces europaeiscabiei TaxID=146819 RepID=UPI0029B61669|nr:CU044_5270 family protein [Streptomyces europaeiscabiei]MDX3631878.1 CU044_5270 family protein [Streptomyces europaeiscabiei]MDX3649659.1 CU044_5270 family protein [Streptomyces europaeiscabiei]
MNASPSHRPHPAEWTETQSLLPSAERDLPAGRHQFHKEQMMARIHEDLRTPSRTSATSPVAPVKRSNPFLRRTILLPAAAFALAGAVAGGLALTGGGAGGHGGTTALATGPALTTRIGVADAKGAPQLLERISLAAADTSEPTPRKGQYIYIASKVADTYIAVDGDNKSEAVSTELHSRQVWKSLDGRDGWLIEAGETSDKGITLQSDIPDSSAYNALAELPTDPDALLQRIYRASDAVRDPEVPRDQAAFVAIGDMLFESYPPAEVGAALYKAAAKIPGVVAVNDVVDATGRHGIAIARENPVAGERTEWIFDKKTLRFLGERSVVVKATADSPLKVGTVTHTRANTERAFVDAAKQLPGQAS